MFKVMIGKCCYCIGLSYEPLINFLQQNWTALLSKRCEILHQNGPFYWIFPKVAINNVLKIVLNLSIKESENFAMENCLKHRYLQTCQISTQYNNVWEWLKLSAGHITLPAAKKAPSRGNFSKILSEYGAHVQGLAAVKRTENFLCG